MLFGGGEKVFILPYVLVPWDVPPCVCLYVAVEGRPCSKCMAEGGTRSDSLNPNVDAGFTFLVDVHDDGSIMRDREKGTGTLSVLRV